MFSVDLKHCYYPKNYDEAVYHKKEGGPDFGGGSLDLRWEPMNGESNGVCLTVELDDNYQIPKDDDGNSTLIGEGKEESDFTCLDCEVY